MREPKGSGGEGRFASTLPWLALAVALSPVLVGLARDLATSAESRYIAPFPILLLLAARGRASDDPRRDGALLVGAGLLFEMIGIAGAATSVARLGLPLCIVGLARALGAPALPAALLSLWFVPIPISIVAATSPELESALAALYGGVAYALGTGIHASGPLLLGADGVLELFPADAGLVLAWTLAGLGWYRGLQLERRGRALCLGSLRWAASALVVQPLALGCAVGVYALGFADLARTGLSYLPWLVTGVLALVGGLPPARRGSAPRG